MVRNSFTEDEKLIAEALLAARQVQEFLWQDLSLLHENYDPNIWAQVFGKRLDKVLAINPNTPAAKVELRKRLLQQAALSICAMRILDGELPVDTNLLKHVIINKADTCWTYVLRRTGTQTECEWLKDVDQHFDFATYRYDKVKKGDIVLWRGDERRTIEPVWEITHNSILTSHKVEIGTHAGVIEGQEVDGRWMVSDVTRKVMPNAVPTIRIRYVGVGKEWEATVREPDFIITPKK